MRMTLCPARPVYSVNVMCTLSGSAAFLGHAVCKISVDHASGKLRRQKDKKIKQRILIIYSPYYDPLMICLCERFLQVPLLSKPGTSPTCARPTATSA